jgi:DNA-binding MarR family transcriptional regulator
LHFGSIPKNSYKQFIIEKFQEAGKSISPEVVDDALDWASVHTYYVQLICNRLFANAPEEVTEKDLNLEIVKILEEQEIVFFQYRELLTKPQWNLLMAIGLEEKVGSPTSMGFINKYKLGSSASVLRSLQSLEQKEMIYSDPGENGQKQYQVYDVLLKRWLQYKFQAHEI